MSKRKIKSGDFCWIDLMASDLDTAKKFYKDVFAWNITEETMPTGEAYPFLCVGEEVIGGAMQIDTKMQQHGVTPNWNSYVMVDDADATAAKAKQLGAHIIREAFDVADFGRMAVIADPTGAVFSIWQSKKSNGEMLEGKTPGACGWFELKTHDTDKAKTFYCDLFGWQAQTQEFQQGVNYTSFMNADSPVGGLIKLTAEMDEQTPCWALYFTVESFTEAKAKAEKAGAKMTFEPVTLAEVGTFTGFTDPEGARFSIIEFS